MLVLLAKFQSDPARKSCSKNARSREAAGIGPLARWPLLHLHAQSNCVLSRLIPYLLLWLSAGARTGAFRRQTKSTNLGDRVPYQTSRSTRRPDIEATSKNRYPGEKEDLNAWISTLSMHSRLR
jgi:hypothetical protein